MDRGSMGDPYLLEAVILNIVMNENIIGLSIPLCVIPYVI